MLTASRDDMYAPDSIELLQKSGLDFQRHEEFGILPNDFAELMITSGLVLNPDNKWISFHRCVVCHTEEAIPLRSPLLSGYDFGYFVKLLTAKSLPTSEDEFFELLKLWFPTVYDIKFLRDKLENKNKGGLQDLADELEVVRIGSSHQAGSDSLLTASVFFELRKRSFNDGINDAEYSGKLYGLGQTFSTTEQGRGGTTIAEREDRQYSSAQHPASAGVNGPQTPGVTMMPMQSGVLPAVMGNPYAQMGTNGGQYMRSSLVGGR
jgi:CCR4-NOT transcription complex subunit 7/8